MNFDEQVAWYCKGGPNILDGFSARGAPELGLGDGGHGEIISIGYRLVCKCGCETFAVQAYSWTNPDFDIKTTISPVKVTCSACGFSKVIFDSAIHGYDPITSGYETTVNGLKDKTAVPFDVAAPDDPKCVDVLVYFPDDLFDEDFDDLAERRRDLFTWLRIVVGEDANPDYPMLDFECA